MEPSSPQQLTTPQQPQPNPGFWTRSKLAVLVVLLVLVGGAVYYVAGNSSNDNDSRLVDITGATVPITEAEAKELYTVAEIKQYSQDNPVPVPVVGAYWGIYSDPAQNYDYTVQGRKNQINAREALVGRSFAIDRQFYTWGKEVPTEYDKWTAAQGRIPHISIKAPSGSGSWKSVANGSHDTYIRQVAQGFKQLGSPAFFTFHHEPDDNVGENGTAAEYVAAFRHIDDIFNKEGVTNVAMTTVSVPYTYQKNPQLADALYPGDDVIDWIGTDPYNFFTRDGVWRDLSTVFDTWYKDVTAEHPTKPLLFAEWGTNIDPKQAGREAQWFANVLQDIKLKYPAIKAVQYFDVLKDTTTFDWRIDQTTSMKNAFKSMGNDVFFASPLFSYDDGGQDALTPPENVSVVSRDGALLVQWDANAASQKVSQYAVRHRAVGVSSWEYNSWTSANSLEITNLENGKQYEVQVRAIVSSDTKSNFSPSVFGTPAVPLPTLGVQPPTGLKLSSVNDTIVASWNSVSDSDFNSYAIRYKPSSADGSAYIYDRSDQNTYTASSLTFGTSYDFQIRTVLNSSKSEWSGSVTILLQEPPQVVPDIPSNLEVQKCGAQCLRATWNKNPESEPIMYALRYRVDGGDWVNEDRTTDTAKVVGKLQRGQRYEVQISAVDSLERKSAYSNSTYIQL